MSITVHKHEDNGIEIVGSLNGREIVCIDGENDTWTISMSRNLPLKAEEAGLHIAVYNEAMAAMDHIKATGEVPEIEVA